MSWIRSITYEESEGSLRRLYDRVRGPGEYIDNILKVHSLRPHTLEGHMALYKNVLHHQGNALPKWLLETVGIYVSLLNRCAYCVDHHTAGLRRLVGDERAAAIVDALKSESQAGVFDECEAAVLAYARRLTLAPADITEAHIDGLRAQGLTDGEILEVNQVTAYFAYANRTVLGLGVTTEGDELGLSPGGDEADGDWRHR